MLYCAVPENINTPPWKGLQFPCIGVGWGSVKDMYEALLEIQEGWGGGGFLNKCLPWGRYRYFLELQKNNQIATCNS